MTLTDKVVRLREIEGVICASSRDIERDFRKLHRHILQTIDGVLDAMKALPPTSRNLDSLNWFRSDSYFDSKQERRRCYDMTEEGFALIVGRYGGRDALEWQIAYHTEFQTMKAKLGRAGARGAYEVFEPRREPIHRDNVVAFEGPPKPQTELFDTPALDANARHLRAITGVGHSVSFDELSVAQHRELIRNSVETWTDHHDGVAYPIRRINSLRGQAIFLYVGTGYPVDLMVPNADGQSRVMVRVAKTLPYSAFPVVERNYLKLGKGEYTPIAVATLRHWLAP